ncbi:MAG: hypothetical protein ACRC31_01820 [Cetobacterium sp.]
MLVTIDFFKSLFKKTFNIGTDQNKIDNNQQIDEAYVIELLAMNETQFIQRIKNMGYAITDTTATTNIIFYICYKTAELLILGNYTMVKGETTIDYIIKKSIEFENLALQDLNQVVQNIPIGGYTITVPKENLCP